MLKHLLTAVAVGVFVCTPLSARAQATVCKDGTNSATTGRGACSGHGGVDKSATTAAAKTSAKAAKTTTTTTATTTASTAAQVKCTDGTMSKAGRGACSGHGGMAANAQASVAAPPPPPPAAAPARTRTTTTTTASTSKMAGPDGATAKCKDGTYSHSQHHTGTCSKHGGVAEWYKN